GRLCRDQTIDRAVRACEETNWISPLISDLRPLRQRTKSPCPPMDGLAVARRLTSVFCRSPLNFSTARQRFSFQRLSFSGIYLLSFPFRLSYFALPNPHFRISPSYFPWLAV